MVKSLEDPDPFVLYVWTEFERQFNRFKPLNSNGLPAYFEVLKSCLTGRLVCVAHKRLIGRKPMRASPVGIHSHKGDAADTCIELGYGWLRAGQLPVASIFPAASRP